MHRLTLPEPTRSLALFDDELSIRALEMLWRANQYAIDVGKDAWDFAVEIDELRHAQISHGALRWLLYRGYARHAREASPRNGKRRFIADASASFCKKSCFVIDEAGLALLNSSRLLPPSDPGTGRSSPISGLDSEARPVGDVPLAAKPVWNSQRRELWVQGRLVKRLRRPSSSQQTILEAFEAAHWPMQIIDPLPLQPAQCPKRRLHDAIKSLNRRHFRQAIRFGGDGSGRGVLWECID